jgi:hypothetical protein
MNTIPLYLRPLLDHEVQDTCKKQRAGVRDRAGDRDRGLVRKGTVQSCPQCPFTVEHELALKHAFGFSHNKWWPVLQDTKKARTKHLRYYKYMASINQSPRVKINARGDVGRP